MPQLLKRFVMEAVVLAAIGGISALSCTRPAPSAARTRDLPPNLIEFANLELRAMDYPHTAQLAGRLRNKSTQRSLRQVLLELSVQDCGSRSFGTKPVAMFYRRLTPEDDKLLAQLDALAPKVSADRRASLDELHRRKALQANCETVEQQRLTILRVVPPLQARDFEERLTFPNLREAAGQHFWTYRVLAAKSD